MRILQILFAGLILLGGMTGEAVELTWNGGGNGNWNDASSWNPSQAPTATDTMILGKPVNGKQIYNGNLSLADGGSITYTTGNDSTFSSFTGNLSMTGGTFTVNQKRLLAGAASGTTNWDISGGNFSYTHSDGSKNGTFRFGTCWENNTPVPTGDYNATLNISGNSKFYADRFILGYANGGLGTNTITANMNVSGNADVDFGPSAGDEYSVIGRGKGVTATLTVSDNATLDIQGALLFGSENGTGTLNQTGGAITALSTTTVNLGSAVNISGGTKSSWSGMAVQGELNITGGSGISFGTLTVRPGGTANFSTATIQASGLIFQGTAIINSGAINVAGDWKIQSLNTEAIATTTVKSGTVGTIGQIYVGFDENYHGKFVVEGGKITASYLQTGSGKDSEGYVEISGGEIATTQGIRIGRNTKGYLTMSGGTLTVGTNGSAEKALSLGYEGTGSYGQIDMTGGTIDTTAKTGSGLYIGRAGTGVATIDQAAGKTTTVKTGTLALGNAAGSNGTLTLKGGTVTASDKSYIGHEGTGEATVSGGTLTINNTLSIGEGTTTNVGNGTLNISDAGKVVVNNVLFVGTGNVTTGEYTGTGTLNQTGGELTVQGDAGIRKGSVVTISGGTSNWNTDTGRGTSVWTGAKLEVTGGDVTFGILTSQGGGTIDINGGTVLLKNLAGTGGINLNGGNVTVNSANIATNGTIQLAGGNDDSLTLSVGTDTTLMPVYHSSGLVTLKSGNVHFTGELRIDRPNGSETSMAELCVDGANLTSDSQIQAGFYGENAAYGKFTVKSGTVETQYVQVGGNADHLTSVGYMDMQGGTVSTQYGVRLGRNGSGYLTMSGGTLNTATTQSSDVNTTGFFLGFNGAKSYGQIDMTGGTIDTITNIDNSASIYVGNSGTGLANIGQADGNTTLVKTTRFYLGNGTGSAGTLNQTGGTIQAVEMLVGNQGTGTLDITGGSISLTSNFIVGNNSTGSLATIHGENATVEAYNVYVGNNVNSSGTLKLESGTLKALGSDTENTIGNIKLGNGNNTTGKLEVTGGEITGKNLYVGWSGAGTATISENADVRMTNDLYIGRTSTSTGTLNIEGGYVEGAYFCIGFDRGSTGTVHVTGGDLKVTANLRVGLRGTGHMTVSGGANSVSTKNLFVTPNSSLTFAMENGRLTPITVSTAANLTGGTLTAEFDGALVPMSKDGYTLVNNVTGTVSTTLKDSDYFKVSQSGTNIVAKANTEVLPNDRSTFGVAEITADGAFTFYTGLWENPNQLDMFVTWLNDEEPSLNAQAMGLGGVLLTLPTHSDYLLWDFTAFNQATGLNALFSTTPIVPEPSSWLLLLLGFGLLARRKNRV